MPPCHHSNHCEHRHTFFPKTPILHSSAVSIPYLTVCKHPVPLSTYTTFHISHNSHRYYHNNTNLEFLSSDSRSSISCHQPFFSQYTNCLHCLSQRWPGHWHNGQKGVL